MVRDQVSKIDEAYQNLQQSLEQFGEVYDEYKSLKSNADREVL